MAQQHNYWSIFGTVSKDYDYIIIGAGSAGCVLANRLSADPSLRILLLEAGGRDTHPLMSMPLAFFQLLRRPEVNWGFETEPEEHANGRRIPVLRGRTLGGSSSINGMMYTRGDPRDYDQWAQIGNIGWAYDDVLPYFKRSETNWRGHSEFHGGDGPLSVSRHPTDNDLFRAVAQTAESKGYRVTDDFEAGDAEGFGVPDFTVHDGRRGSTAKRFLQPVRTRPNLEVVINATCTRIVLENKRATGIEYLADGRLMKARAAREVILSGGAYNSPQLLMLSGIGPGGHLREMGIDTVLDLPGVGRNLQEHPSLPMRFDSKKPMDFEKSIRFDRLAASVARWQFTGKGLPATLPLTAIAFLKTMENLERPDLEILMIPTAMDANVWFPGIKKGRGHVISASCIILRPDSRGTVELRSANPLDAPRIRWNLLAEQSDRALLRRGVRWMRDFVRAAPLSDFVGDEVLPGPQVDSDEAIDAYARGMTGTAHHPTSTCSMGTGSNSVVDPELRVHGIEGLRVVDASIMPIIVGGHTNAPTIMIAERAADLILGKVSAKSNLTISA